MLSRGEIGVCLLRKHACAACTNLAPELDAGNFGVGAPDAPSRPPRGARNFSGVLC